MFPPPPPPLVGDGSCGLNVHNTGAHLADYVEGWGPLWAWSTFGFEDMNGTIMVLTHGTGNVCRQVLLTETVYLHLYTTPPYDNLINMVTLLLWSILLTKQTNAVLEKIMYSQVCYCLNGRIQLCSLKFPWLVLNTQI